MKYNKIRIVLIELIVVYAVIAFMSPYKILKTLFILIVPMLIISIIALNVKERLNYNKVEQNRLRNFCNEKIATLKKHMTTLYKLNKNYRLSKVEHFLNRLSKCTQTEDFQSLLNLINHEIMYISAVIEVWSKESSQSSREDTTYQEKSSIKDKKIIAALLILDLSSKTKDFNLIKKQYRSLMLKYHPDRNHTEEANEIAISINAAYELLETVFN